MGLSKESQPTDKDSGRQIKQTSSQESLFSDDISRQNRPQFQNQNRSAKFDLHVSDVLSLQRMVGNQAVMRALEAQGRLFTKSPTHTLQRNIEDIDIPPDRRGEKSTDGRAIVVDGKLYMREDNQNLPQVQMSGQTIGPGGSQRLGEGSFINFTVGSDKFVYEGRNYVRIVPQFKLTRAFEGESERAKTARNWLARADEGETEFAPYWLRTYSRNKPDALDDSIFAPLFSSENFAASEEETEDDNPFLLNQETRAALFSADDEPHENARDLLSSDPDIEYPQSLDRSQPGVDMAGPADCESFSALAQGLQKKRARRLCYLKQGIGGSEQKLLPVTSDPEREFMATSPYRNTVPRNTPDGKVNLSQSPGQALVDEMLFRTVMEFIHNPDNASYLQAVHHQLPPNPTSPARNIQQYYQIGSDGILEFNSEVMRGPQDQSVAQGTQIIKNLYWGLTPDGRKKFDKEHGIGQYANPKIGEAYMMATQDDAPHFQDTPAPSADEPAPGTWGMHWGTVILDLGTEKITLEGYAQSGLQDMLRGEGLLGKSEMLQVRDAVFAMYSGLSVDTGEPLDPNKTFQSKHLDSGTHGNAAITARFVVQ